MMKKIFTFFAALACVMSMSAETTRLYCKMAQDWWKADGAAVGAYYWGTGAAPQWPGNRMIPVKGETDLWYVDIDATQYQNIIFTRVNGSGTVSDWGAKTADLVVPTDGKNLYTITSTSPVWGDPGVTGEWSVYTTSTPDPTPDPEPEPEPGTGEPTPETGITYNVTVPAGTNACYIAGEMNTWTHQEMTKVDDTHYTLTIAEATTTMKYKYCSGPGWAYVEKTATGDEVADRTHTENDVVEAWAAVYDPNNVPSQGETKDITVKAKVPAAWTDQITAWVWPTGGEGQEVIPTQEGEWYVVTHNCAELNIIFRNGAGWTVDANQTVDMTFTQSTCIEITAGEGKATYTVVDCSGEPGENPGENPSEVSYVLMGIGGDWTTGIALEVNPDNAEEYQLLCQTISDGDAVKVVTIINGEQKAWCGNVEEASVAHTADDMGNVVLTPGIYDFYFKAAADIMYIGKAACDTTGTTPENPETPNPETGVTYNVTVPAGTNACYIAGEMNTWTHQEMTKVDDTHYTLTIAEATTTMKYKYCSGPGWAYVEKTATGDEVADRTHTENDVVEAWAAVYDPNNVPSQGETKDITVKAKVPATWTDQITAWVWATGGEGTEVVPAQEGEWYVYTQNCAELNIIFKNGAGWNGDANQTVDITVSESTCIEITAGEGKATYTLVDCEGGTTTDDEQVVINKKATKIVYNGQICIIRDGVMFNILGQVIK